MTFAIMELSHLKDASVLANYSNGAVPIKKARTELSTAGSSEAQIRRQKEADKKYGGGRKIAGK